MYCSQPIFSRNNTSLFKNNTKDFLKSIDKKIIVIALAIFSLSAISYAILTRIFFKKNCESNKENPINCDKNSLETQSENSAENKDILLTEKVNQTLSKKKEEHDEITSKKNDVVTKKKNDGITSNEKEKTEDDYRKGEWFKNTTHILPYARDWVKRINPNVIIVEGGLKDSFIQKYLVDNPLPEAFALPSTINKHHILIYTCTKTRKVEYYDSFIDYGYQMEDLEKFATKLDQWIPGTTPFQVVPKIKKKLQNDGYQCGPWSLYFLEQRAQNPKVDFNQLDIDSSQQMIQKFRLKMVDRLVELGKIKKK